MLRANFLVIIALLLVIGLGRGVQVHGATAVLLYDHGFAKDIARIHGNLLPLNVTSTFTQDDVAVYAFVHIAFYSANLTWLWYDPSGHLYYSEGDVQECTSTVCGFESGIVVGNYLPAARVGLWMLNLLVDGNLLYSDHFLLNPVIRQENRWNFRVVESFPRSLHVDLTVMIHPNNGTWNFYKTFLPYASNVSAYELVSKHPLQVFTFNDNSVVVDLGVPRLDGYTFGLSFDLINGVRDVNGYGAGVFMLSWKEAWQRISDIHPTPETFNITLPQRAILLNTSGTNKTISHNVAEGRPSLSFTMTLSPNQPLAWNITYADFTYINSRLNTRSSTSTTVLPSKVIQSTQLPPLDLGNVSLWAAVVSVILFAGSEFLPSSYTRPGMLINRRRLRIAALTFVVLFLGVTAYQLLNQTSQLVYSTDTAILTVPAAIFVCSLCVWSILKVRRNKSKAISMGISTPTSIVGLSDRQADEALRRAREAVGRILTEVDLRISQENTKSTVAHVKEKTVGKFSEERFKALIEQEKDPRTGVKLAFRFAQSLVNESLGDQSPMNETHREFYYRATTKRPDLEIKLRRLVEIFETAEYTDQPIHFTQREEIIEAVVELVNLLGDSDLS